MSVHHIVQFNTDGIERVFDLSNEQEWNFQSIGLDEFVFSSSQLEKIKAAGIPFKEVGTGPRPEHLDKLKKRAKKAKA